jgi:hypothetical protein
MDRSILLVAACALSAPALTAAQVMQGSTPGGGDCTDKVRIVSKKPLPGSTPLNKKLELTLQNLCTGSQAGITAPWRITVDNSLVASGTALMPAGATVTVSGEWTMRVGTFSFGAVVDPNNTLNEPEAARANNGTLASQFTVTNVQFNIALQEAWAAAMDVCADRVEVTAITLTPQTPIAGALVNVAMKLRNKCTVAHSFSWTITRGQQVLGSGETGLVDGKGEVSISRTWTATGGTHSLSVEADPSNATGEEQSYRANNKKTTTVTISSGTQGH